MPTNNIDKPCAAPGGAAVANPIRAPSLSVDGGHGKRYGTVPPPDRTEFGGLTGPVILVGTLVPAGGKGRAR